jgi:hypothetical protein
LQAPAAATSASRNIAVPTAPLEIWKAILFLLVLVLLAESLVGNSYLAPQRGNP